MPPAPLYIAILYIFKDSECQPVCRPTSKSFKGGIYMYPVGYIIYYTLKFEICQDIS
jgi:hypothetical protein